MFTVLQFTRVDSRMGSAAGVSVMPDNAVVVNAVDVNA